MHKSTVCVAALAAVVLMTSPVAQALGTVGTHVTDGAFGIGEWTGAGVVKSSFPPVGPNGGATLYVAQGLGDGNLYLMYDYTRNTSSPFSTSSFFDVFFQVPSDNSDYGVHITATGFQVFEKPIGTVSGLHPDGSLDFAAPWQPFNATTEPVEFQTARFQAAIGFGTSPDSATPHQMAEFQLSVNTNAFGPGGQPGLYDPAPAFWSASGGTGGLPDPPISSAIFTLNPDGTTTVTPALASDGGPALQPQDVSSVPLPATVWCGSTLLLALAGLRALRVRQAA